MADNGNEFGRRLTRLEDFVEVLAEGQKQLLTAQIVLTDRLDKLTERVDRIAEAQVHTDERLNVLIKMMDEWVRRQPPSIQ